MHFYRIDVSQRGLTPLTQGEMKMSIFTGCGTALITPFKHGEIDWPALDNLVESQIEAGIDALIAAPRAPGWGLQPRTPGG